MSFVVVRKSKPSWKALLGLLGVVLIALVAGFLVGMPSGEVPPVWAALCQASHGCGYGYLHAVMTVTHVDTSHVPQPVRSDTGESLKITAYWNTDPPGPCTEYSEYATADVDYSGGSFVLSNVNLPTYITDLYLCSGPDSCSEEYATSYNYKIIAKVTDPVWVSSIRHNLRQVVFETTSVDDGLIVDYDTCTTGSSVSPTSQTFSQTDNGAFECSSWPDCTATGPTLQLTYE